MVAAVDLVTKKQKEALGPTEIGGEVITPSLVAYAVGDDISACAGSNLDNQLLCTGALQVGRTKLVGYNDAIQRTPTDKP